MVNMQLELNEEEDKKISLLKLKHNITTKHDVIKLLISKVNIDIIEYDK